VTKSLREKKELHVGSGKLLFSCTIAFKLLSFRLYCIKRFSGNVKPGISICCVLRATDRSVERDPVKRRMSCTRAALSVETQ
jgi:hypothetical protein